MVRAWFIPELTLSASFSVSLLTDEPSIQPSFSLLKSKYYFKKLDLPKNHTWACLLMSTYLWTHTHIICTPQTCTYTETYVHTYRHTYIHIDMILSKSELNSRTEKPKLCRDLDLVLFSCPIALNGIHSWDTQWWIPVGFWKKEL